MAASAAEQIRARRRRDGRRLVVLDDDPTGSQSVHDVQIVTDLDRRQYAAALAEPGATCFVLTNSRALPRAEAVALTERVVADVLEVERELGAVVDIVSRGDSTLRGHILAEPAAIDRVRAATTGRGYDGVLFAPGFFEAGRVTDGDIHWLVDPSGRTPVGESEFARDATFGYRSSNLADLVAELADGPVPGGRVHSLSRELIARGPGAVAEVLAEVRDGAFVVVNGIADDDYETVVLGALEAEADGRRLLYRTGPSFVRALAGIPPSHPLTAAQIGPRGANPHGLVVVGSHVERSTEQLAGLAALDGIVTVEIDVPRVVDGDAAYADELAATVRAGLAEGDVVLATSRRLVTAPDPEASLRISASLSRVVAGVVREVLAARPAWVVAKGGITSHDVAVHGLELRRATVVGQFGRGIISLFRPVDAAPEAIGMPYVVFPGNVGGPDDLARVVRMLRGEAA